MIGIFGWRVQVVKISGMNGYLGRIAPLTDALVAQAVDGAAFQESEGGGKHVGFGIVGHGN